MFSRIDSLMLFFIETTKKQFNLSYLPGWRFFERDLPFDFEPLEAIPRN